MPSHHTADGFSKLRSWMFPIYSYEMSKLIPMGFMLTLISFNFWILHISKDTLVITAQHSGAEVINLLKLPVFIFSIFFVMGYTWFSNIVHQRTIFYSILSFFFIFVLLFIYGIYPHQDSLNLFTPTEISHLKQAYPWAKWVFPVVGYWGYSLFYIISELWGAVVLSLLFWQFANQITSVEQSRRFYMLFGMFNGLGTILSGVFVYYYDKSPERLQGGGDVYGERLNDLLLVFCILTALIIVLYYWINKHSVTPKTNYHIDEEKSDKSHDIKLSFVESFKYILTSRYVGFIALITIAYNISINFVEVTWKSQIEKLYSTPLAMEEYFSLITIYMGILTCSIGFFGAGFVRRFSWRVSSLITPYTMFGMGLLFFATTLYMEKFLWLGQLLGMAPLALSVWMGQTHNLLSKSCKYSFFAATREMAFIPLDAELKVKGKAAVDILSGRVGKFGGSFIQSILLSLSTLGTQSAITSYLVVICVLVFVVWIISINSLNREFLKIAYGSTTAEPLHE